MTDNVVHLDSVKQQAATPAADAVPEFIKPRSIADMTDLEQDQYMAALRDRRLKAMQAVSEAKRAKAEASSLADRKKIESKIVQCERVEQKLIEQTEKLETLVIQLRTLVVQYT